jgi:hypothetical protein
MVDLSSLEMFLEMKNEFLYIVSISVLGYYFKKKLYRK